MGRIFYPSDTLGKIARIQYIDLAPAQTFKNGALVLVNANGLLAEVGADPVKITGVALQDANSGPGYNAADNPTVITGRGLGVSVAIANRDTIFSGRGVNGGVDPVLPLQTHVLYGLSGSAFNQVVLAGNDHKPVAIGRQAETQVAVIRVERELDLRQLRRLEQMSPESAEASVAMGLSICTFRCGMRPASSSCRM